MNNEQTPLSLPEQAEINGGTPPGTTIFVPPVPDFLKGEA